MELSIGAHPSANRSCTFTVWAPSASEMQLHLVAPQDKIIQMDRLDRGYFRATVPNLDPGARYFLRPNGQDDVPDPASRSQPEGVHGPSEVIPSDFAWTDQAWTAPALRDYVIYELHVGTFSPEGTFDGVIPYLQELKALGVSAIEIMPVAQFAGKRNWGYDGVGLYAVQNSCGGPQGLKRLVNAAHEAGLATILDVVYNHLGPEGNYLRLFGPYFTETYRTPWGSALNFDGPHSDGVRQFFIENALYWQTEFHFDALRLDAVHAIRDIGALPFLQELKRATTAQATQLKRSFHLIAETDLNAPRFILPENRGGYGLDAQWADDFHHCLHVLLTGEKRGYYEDYTGGLDQFAKVWREGYAFTGEYSQFRKARHGQPSNGLAAQQFVVCAQNHDQIGNRMTGDRLSTLVEFEKLKLAAACVILSPFTPLLFMGEEYGEPAPFQYFVDHQDNELLAAVQKGRREEFASFAWGGDVPDPASEATFSRSRLNHSLRQKGNHQVLLRFYRKLLSIRNQFRCIKECPRRAIEVKVQGSLLLVQYSGSPDLILALSFSNEPTSSPVPAGNWSTILDSSASEWAGQGIAKTDSRDPIAPWSVRVLSRQPGSAT